MTNIEAIKWLEQIKEKYIHGGDEEFDQCRREAIDVAIKCIRDELQSTNGSGT